LRGGGKGKRYQQAEGDQKNLEEPELTALRIWLSGETGPNSWSKRREIGGRRESGGKGRGGD